MTSQFHSIGLVVRSDMQTRQDSVLRVVEVLSRHAPVVVHCIGFEPPSESLTNVSLSQLVEDVDLVISLGGDGTLLTAARALVDKSTPLLGINLGRLGFLADVSFDERPRHRQRTPPAPCPRPDRAGHRGASAGR